MGMNRPSVQANHQEGGLIGTGGSRDATIDPEKGSEKVPLTLERLEIDPGIALSTLDHNQLRIMASTKHPVRSKGAAGRTGTCFLFQPPCREGCQGSMKVSFAHGPLVNCLIGDLLTA